MCGIIGAIANRVVEADLLHGLKCMEYRGYDSAGICTIDAGQFHCSKAAGKLINLEKLVSKDQHLSFMGIGHTRWATHGEPGLRNAHPHCSHDISVVHNGIIENNRLLRLQLEQHGVSFLSETDSEVVPWMLSAYLLEGCDMKAAMQRLLGALEGAYALGVLHSKSEELYFARKGSPLLLARADGACYLASDALAVAGLASEVMYLKEGDWGLISATSVQVYNEHGQLQDDDWVTLPHAATQTGKAGFDHYMLKEIHEQPQVLKGILQAYASVSGVSFDQADFVSTAVMPERIVMVACGTSYHAALTARYWLERYLKVPVEVDVASEYRYRNPVIGDNTWFISLSQSGETADTLEALRLFRKCTPNNLSLAICNVASSSLVRESDGFIELKAGPEIGVASTKAYTAQLMVLALFSIKLAIRVNAIDQAAWRQHYQAMHDVVVGMHDLLKQADQVETLTPMFSDVHGALFLGRGPSFPLALEGALKLKEISYLHAEGYPAGEMKHGPIALIDDQLPVVVIAPKQYHLGKVISNLHEVKARGAKVILLTDAKDEFCNEHVGSLIELPEGDYFTAPLLASIPLQLLAYYVARSKGTDVDQPRNLAKSVTVE
ncbi:MAG: glutamine--fructose-6-phosphate transaminase (isomerizing) [Mariprofundaceae bacterium]